MKLSIWITEKKDYEAVFALLSLILTGNMTKYHNFEVFASYTYKIMMLKMSDFLVKNEVKHLSRDNHSFTRNII